MTKITGIYNCPICANQISFYGKNADTVMICNKYKTHKWTLDSKNITDIIYENKTDKS